MPPNIFEAAYACNRSLERCQEFEVLTEDDWAWNQLVNFGWLATRLKANIAPYRGIQRDFSAPIQESLDYRLVHKVAIRDRIVRLLWTLNHMVEECIELAKRDPQPYDGSSGLRPNDPLSFVSHDPLYKKKKEVEKQIDILAKAEVVIERSETCQHTKADEMFKPEDHQDLRAHLTTVLLSQRPFSLKRVFSLGDVDPSSLSAAQFRLINCNLKRRNRFIYAHAQRHPKALDTSSLESAGDDEDEASAHRPSDESSLPQIPVPSPAAVTQLSPAERRKSVFRPPKLPDWQLLFDCPYCCQTLPAALSDEVNWILHLSKDLCPYTCIIPNCSKPDTLYADKTAWMKHLLEDHPTVEYWVCQACNDLVQYDQESFLVHLARYHQGHEEHFPGLLIDGKRKVPEEVKSCPICDWPNGKEVDRQDLIDHIAEGIFAFSLRSFPWVQDEDNSNIGHMGYFTAKILDWLKM